MNDNGSHLPHGRRAPPARENATAADTGNAAEIRANEYHAALVRARTETENVLERARREAGKTRRYALEGFARDLLPVKDNLERGLQAGDNPSALREGTELTLRLLEQVFERNGIEAIDPIGRSFDPRFHEAMSTAPRTDVEPGTVVAVYEKGYTLNGRLLRPARVQVSAAPATARRDGSDCL